MVANNIASIAESLMLAAIGTSSWEAAMDAAASISGGVGAVLLPVRGSRIDVPYSQSIGEVVESYVRDGWVQRDVRYRSMPAMLRRGVTTDLDFATPDEITRHPYYQEFLAPHNLRWYAGVKVQAGDDLWTLSIQRSTEQGPFSKHDLGQLAALSPRLSSAAAVAIALGSAKVEAALAAFEASATAVILIDRGGQVQGLNSVAHGLLGPHLKVERRRLVSWSREATAALDRALHVLVWKRDGPSSEIPLVLPRIAGRPIIAYPARLPGVTDDYFARARAILVLHDLEAKPLAAEPALRRLFKLTASEARIATRIGSGESVDQAADQLSISYETARSLLKAVLQKTETHRQAELVSLFARIAPPPVVQPPDGFRQP